MGKKNKLLNILAFGAYCGLNLDHMIEEEFDRAISNRETKVLLSIKPKFANLIFEGVKYYEFRRQIFKKHDINKVIVYASHPVQKIIGEFQIDEIIEDRLDNLWMQTKDGAGISKDYFLKYFDQKKKGFAIKIKKTWLYDDPVSLDRYGLSPPQSFCYVK